MPEDVAIDTGGGSGPLGFSWPVVLGGLLVVVVGLVWLRSRGGSGGGVTVSRADVMLADLQGRADLIRQDVQQGSAADAAAAAASAARDQSLYGEVWSGINQSNQEHQFLYNTIWSGISQGNAEHQALYTQAQGIYATLAGQLAAAQTAGNQEHAALYQQQLTSLQNILAALNGNLTHPPAGPRYSYAGWQQNFGRTGPNPYDVNQDSLVDIRDYGILRVIFGDAFFHPATASGDSTQFGAA